MAKPDAAKSPGDVQSILSFADHVDFRVTGQADVISPDALPDPAALLDRLDELEAELASLRDELDRTGRLATLGCLAATIVHEYSNLLVPILTYAQLALDHPEEPDLTHKALTKAANGAQQATRIAETLLGFARDHGDPEAAFTADNPDPPPEADVSSAVQAALDLLVRDPAKDGITVQLDLAEAAVAIEPSRLQQVLLNLLLNARKALVGLPRGEARQITVTAAIDHAAVVLTVADTGPGVAAELLPRLFEPFTAGDESTGSGLGLSLCHRLVTHAGGTIEAENAAEGGAVFTVCLPVAKPA